MAKRVQCALPNLVKALLAAGRGTVHGAITLTGRLAAATPDVVHDIRAVDEPHERVVRPYGNSNLLAYLGGRETRQREYVLFLDSGAEYFIFRRIRQ